MVIDRKAEIGIILLACTFLVWILVTMWVDSLPLPHRFLPAIVSKSILVLQNVLIISGLTFYIAGRKRFLTCTKQRIGLALSLSFGLFLLVLGVLGGIMQFGLIGYYHHKVADIGISYSEIFIEEFPSLFIFVLLTISGIILAIDSWKTLNYHSFIDIKYQAR